MGVGAVNYERFTCFYLHSVTEFKGPWCVTVIVFNFCLYRHTSVWGSSEIISGYHVSCLFCRLPYFFRPSLSFQEFY